MPKRRKHPKLPNGYGSIRYLGKGRRRPYAVHPPVKEFTLNGVPVTPPALCYVDDWYVGFAVLNSFRAGTYQPGDELRFKQMLPADNKELDRLCKRLINDYEIASRVNTGEEKTFSDVYEAFFEWKYGEHAKKKLSKQTVSATQSAYKNCAVLHNRVFKDLRHADLQACIDDCPLKSSSISNIASLFRQMYKYALLYEICDRDYSGNLSLPADDNEHGVPFSDEELSILWKHKDNPVIEFLLIMCYSGYRISAYKSLEVNTDEWYFKGGVKTAAGKDRIVPIHSAIKPLVTARLQRYGTILRESTETYRESMYKAVDALGMEKHTPHDCRHTFSRLCEKYGVNENDRKRMLGHSFGADITNAVYGHRTLEELRTEIEKIVVTNL